MDNNSKFQYGNPLHDLRPARLMRPPDLSELFVDPKAILEAALRDIQPVQKEVSEHSRHLATGCD